MILHCCTVKAVAAAIAEGISCDIPLITAGALLHDIGRSKDHTIMHAIAGAEIAMRIGLPDEITEIIRRHIGAGIDDEEAVRMGMPKGDYIPRTIEEKIVAHADNMVSDNKVVAHSYSVEKLRMKGSERGARRMAELHRELSGLYGKDLDNVASSLGEAPALAALCAALAGK